MDVEEATPVTPVPPSPKKPKLELKAKVEEKSDEAQPKKRKPTETEEPKLKEADVQKKIKYV